MAQKECSKCGNSFICTNETAGCWCEKVQLNAESLQFLKANYANCLCPACLKYFEEKEKNTCSITEK